MTVALVTGAAGGIGGAVAERLSAQHTVVRSDLTVPSGSSTWMECDVSDHEAVEDLVKTVEAEHGPIFHLVHAAGTLTAAPALQADYESIERMLAVNLLGTINVLTSVGRLMSSRREGSIVAVTSNSAKVARAGISAYAATKAATEVFSQCLALELAVDGVRVNTVAPGSTRTRMLTRLNDQGYDERGLIEGSLTQYKPGIPLGRIAEPDDVAAALEFLLSPGARHITMHSLTVDGGASLGQ
jgi:2,3-dihydro-2,3-dihydroxybenzoate dehydrogenase